MEGKDREEDGELEVNLVWWETYSPAEVLGSFEDSCNGFSRVQSARETLGFYENNRT